MSETLLNEIRATKPEAPAALRERVRALSVQEPAREPFLDRFRFNWGWRRLVLAVPATVVVALVAAGVIGLSRDDAGDEASAVGGRATRRRRAPRRAPPAEDSESAAPKAASPAVRAARPGSSHRRPASCSATRPSSACRSTTSRRSRPRPSARSRSRATTAAASPRCSTTRPSEGVGTAQITLRVPTARVESAMAQLSQLGTIVGQRYGIDDLQQQADSLQSQIEADAAPDRAARLAAREHDALGRRTRRPPVAALERPHEADGPARGAAGHERRGAHGDHLPDDDDRGDPGGPGRRRPARRRQGRARLGGDRAPLRARRRRPVRRSSASSSGSPCASCGGARPPGCSSRTSFRRASGARPARSCPGRARSRRGGGHRAPPPGRTARGDRFLRRRPRRRRRRRRPRPRARRRPAPGRPGLARRGVLGDVRERLRDHVERGGLDRLGQPLRGRPFTSTGNVARVASASTAGIEPVVGEDRRMDPAGELTELLQAERELVARLRDQLRRGCRIVGQPRLGNAKPERERDQTLLRAVVEVPLQPPPLGVAGLDDARPRRRQLLAGLRVRERDRDEARELLEPGPRRRAGIGRGRRRSRSRWRPRAAPRRRSEPPRPSSRRPRACAPGVRAAPSPGRSAPIGPSARRARSRRPGTAAARRVERRTRRPVASRPRSPRRPDRRRSARLRRRRRRTAGRSPPRRR